MLTHSPLPVLVLTCTILAACTPNHPVDNTVTPATRTQALANEGTVCLFGLPRDDIKVYYLPLGTTCASSSLHRWNDSRLTAVITPQAGSDDAVHIDSYTTHHLSNSPVATADCAGAGIQTAQLDIQGYRGFAVFWGNHRIGSIANGEGAILCKKLDASGTVTPAPELHDEIRSMAQADTLLNR